MECKEVEEEDGRERVVEVLAVAVAAVDEPPKEPSLEGMNWPIWGRWGQRRKGPCKRSKMSVCKQMYDF